MEKKIKFELSNKFVRMNCLTKKEGNICPFLQQNGNKFECINFTDEGIILHKKIIPEKSKIDEGMIKLGCDYVIQKILRNKSLFIGRIVEYTSGPNIVVKTISDITHNRKNRAFNILLMTPNSVMPFPFPVYTDYLCIEELKNENIIRIINKLGGSSIDIFM